jgi:hypothetical protein
VARTQIQGGGTGSQIKSGTITNTEINASAAIALSKLAEAVLQADGGQAFTADMPAGGFKVTGLGDGTANTDAATYGQVLAAMRGQDGKSSVRVATTGAETYTISTGAVTQIAGTTLNGISPAVNDRILIKNAPAATGAGVADTGSTGSSQPANGIYKVTNATTNLTVTRDVDADVSAEVTGGLTVWVDEGTAVSDTQWTLITNDAITLNTTALQFTKSGGAPVTADGTSLTQSGNTITRAALTGDVTASSGSNATTIAAGVVSLSKMASLAANSVIANNTGSGATPTALGLTAAATASTAMLRDTNANAKVNVMATGVTTTATAAGTTTLTVASTQFQQFTGSTTQIVVLPDATTLVTGHSYIVANKSSGAVQVNANGGGGVLSVTAGDWAIITLIAAGSAAGTWDSHLALSSTAAGLTTSNFVTRETPSGTVNGSTTAFTLANTPTSGTEEVYLDGQLQEPGGEDYSISSATVTFVSAPLTGQRIRVNYRK